MDTKPKLYYYCINGVAFDNFCSDAAIGARDSGIETVPFEDIEQIVYDPYNIVVAPVEDTLIYLNKEIPVINHSWTYEYLKRGVNLRYIEEIKENEYPIFIKPARQIKGFTGFVALNKQDAIRNSDNFSGKIVSQEVIDIRSEYRVYIDRDRGILGVKHYLGDPFICLDKDFVNSCYQESKKHLKERSYTLDFGINDQGETFLIEVNDGWAIGNYGLDSQTYYNFIKNRFLQLTGIIK